MEPEVLYVLFDIADRKYLSMNALKWSIDVAPPYGLSEFKSLLQTHVSALLHTWSQVILKHAISYFTWREFIR